LQAVKSFLFIDGKSTYIIETRKRAKIIFESNQNRDFEPEIRIIDLRATIIFL